ncbi:U6 snRNA phosphodiesterase isoform X1 [Bombus vosnesenskii]|uniref:U6 snRNA phosphodiesterase n=1 Tax=Bombus vosnesenskii TaxID=207650 RepID=A0A6J3JYS1_9HYME|nr:U6 snRNA phosphodiesterase isoform X1 [Bombus vancouverensis nearcticus]XP_033345987.1 U6 snRNA phosphodiesterase isoform X1 [Bombus vosnesenskii]
MSGLDLLSTYASDSEEDEINDNSKSEENSKRLPLPRSITAWKGVPHHEEVDDNPLQHEGRVRSFKHERGNWATLIYIDYEPSEDMLSWMFSVLGEVPVKCNIFSEQFHISLSRTLILKFHWIESFVEETKKLCEQTDQFNLELLNVRAYTNEEKTRTFLGIECIDCKGVLGHFVKNVNKLLAEYDLPAFYEDSSYHVSFLWCLGNELSVLDDQARFLTIKLNQFLIEHAEARYINVNKIYLKIGNKLYVFKLR